MKINPNVFCINHVFLSHVFNVLGQGIHSYFYELESFSVKLKITNKFRELPD